jgi:hypothetical protein
MDKTAKRRWAVLLGALALTIAAIVLPDGDPDGAGSVVQVARSDRPRKTSTPAVEVDRAQPTLDTSEPVDPFAPRGWQAPPPPVPAAVIQQATASPVEPPPPAGPPPLPFKFMGRLNDGGAEVVYLSRGDQTVVARDGETLEGTYKVVGVSRQQIEFEYLPTGEKQALAIPVTEN